MTIPETLEKYLYGEIVPRYAAFDAAHREDHALTVMEQSMKLLADRSEWLAGNPEPQWAVEVDPAMLLTAAACHDLGLSGGRDRHHLDSGVKIRACYIFR